MFTVRFPRTQFDSKAGSSYIGTTGIEVGIGDPVSLRPINTKGDVSQQCEIQVARDSIPEIIAALMDVYSGSWGAWEIAKSEFAVENSQILRFPNPGKVYDWAHEKTGQPFGMRNPVEGQVYEPRLVNPTSVDAIKRRLVSAETL